MRRSGPKTLDRQANLGDLGVKRHATWGMSDVDNRSLWLDVKIIWLTIRKVVKREGISAAGEATMPKFQGKIR